ncbi:hypothetical protein [Pseudonocardia sp. TRM90224]|nr:hypothetical protein [Pseudonocardia sp. TRM90224]
MTEMIEAVLGYGAWGLGMALLLVMAGLPLLEGLGTARDDR